MRSINMMFIDGDKAAFIIKCFEKDKFVLLQNIRLAFVQLATSRFKFVYSFVL